MNVFLLPRKGGRYFFFAPAPEGEVEADGQDGFWQRARKTFESLTSSRGRSEKLLRDMGENERINVFHPARLTHDEAQKIYGDLVEEQIRKHKRWLVVDGVAVPFSALLTLVPGPNVVLAYLAWRTLVHYKTKKGGEKALSETDVAFVKEERLDALADLVNRRLVLGRKQKIRRLGELLGLNDLDQAY